MTVENPDAVAFFADLQESFSSLARTGRTRADEFLVAGLRLRVEATDGGLRDALHRAIGHLAVPHNGIPDLTVSMWDSESTGLADLKPAWTRDAYGRHGLITGFNDARYHTAIQFDPLILRMLDRESSRAIYWTRSARDWPVWERGAPMRPLLHEWLCSRGRLPVHGGAVGRPGGGVFLAGPGGSGKSNVALACVDSDLHYLSDDFCVLSDEPNWQVHSLYCTGKLGAGDLNRHPLLRAHVSNPDSLDHEKALFFLGSGFERSLARTMPLRAIVMPHVVGRGESKIVPGEQATAQRAIALSTIELSRWTGAVTFTEVARFVRALPCFELHLGDDLPRVPALLSDLINRLQCLRSGAPGQ